MPSDENYSGEICYCSVLLGMAENEKWFHAWNKDERHFIQNIILFA